MKARLSGSAYNRGMSTLEILIAFAILTLSMTAIIMVVFGNQSLAVDTQTNIEAISKAQAQLEAARALSRQAFSSVVTMPNVLDVSGPLTYTKTMTVADLTQCKKQATSTVSWVEGSRTLSISLTTFLSDIAGALALGGHCVPTPPSGNWQTLASVSGGDGSVNGSGVFAKNSVAYVSANSTSANKPDLLIYAYDPGPPKAVKTHGWIDISTYPGLSSSNGLNGVVVVGNYAYGVNSQKNNQLVIINVQNIENPNVTVVNSITLPNITAGFACPNATNCPPGGKSIYYYNGYLYIGTGYLAFGTPIENHEFHIYCISDAHIPLCSPTTPVWMGSVDIGRNVNGIAIRGHYAYLATSSGKLTIVDLSDLSASPIEVPVSGTEHALSLYIIGNNLYLGRKQGTASEPDIIVYDITNPTNPTSCATCSTNLLEDINAITVFNNMAFLATSKNLEILNVTTPSAISSIASLPLQKAGMGIDYDSSFIYVPIIKQGSVLLNIYYPGP